MKNGKVEAQNGIILFWSDESKFILHQNDVRTPIKRKV